MTQAVPLFVCHANCSRSMLAERLYRQLTGAPATSAAAVAVGEGPAPRTVALLRHWGIECPDHCPRQLTAETAEEAGAIFTMGAHQSWSVLCLGRGLADKTYLFADPFTLPVSFAHEEYHVSDPGFDERPPWEQAPDYAWMRERVLSIRLALLGAGPRPLIPAATYAPLLEATYGPPEH